MRWRHTDADLYHQWEETEERAKKWEKRAKEERKQHERAITDIRAELRWKMAQMRKELEGQIEGLTQENIELRKYRTIRVALWRANFSHPQA